MRFLDTIDNKYCERYNYSPRKIYLYIKKKTNIVISKFETRPKAEIFCSLDLREIL